MLLCVFLAVLLPCSRTSRGRHKPKAYTIEVGTPIPVRHDWHEASKVFFALGLDWRHSMPLSGVAVCFVLPLCLPPADGAWASAVMIFLTAPLRPACSTLRELLEVAATCRGRTVLLPHVSI